MSPRPLIQIAAALLVLTGCATDPLSPAPGVVATVGDEQILAEDLRAHAERVPITLLSSTRGDSVRQQYLRSLLVRRLLARELAVRGLDTTRAITARAADGLRQRLAEIYLREQVWPAISVDKSRVQAFYDSLGLRQRRKVSGIVTATRDEAEQLRQALAAGENFEKLATRHSRHPLSAASGGELGYVTVRQAANLGIPKEIYSQLPDSSISAVLPLADQFQIVRFLHTKISPLEDFVQQILDVLMNQERGRVEVEHVGSLAEEFRWHSNPEAAAILDRRGGSDAVVQPWLLDATEAATPLFTYADTMITIGQLLHTAKRNRREVTDGAAAVRLGQELLSSEHLYAEAARRHQIHERPEVIAWHTTLIEELAITELRRQVLAEDPPATSDDVRNVYRENPDLFRESDDILIVETLVATEAEAQAVLVAVEAGDELLDVARRTTTRTSGPDDARGTLRLNDHERMTNSVLYAAVQEAPLKDIVGPVAVQDGFSVFRIIQRERGALMPFLQVEARAKAFARRFKQNEAFEHFIDELLEHYAEQTQVYEAELTLALPDSLVDEIARRDQARAGLRAPLN